MFQTITHKSPGCEDINAGQSDLSITYNAVNEEQMDSLLKTSTYCHQNLYYTCKNAELNLNAPYGWTGGNGQLQTYWGGNTNGQLINQSINQASKQASKQAIK